MSNTSKYLHFTAANIVVKGILTGLLYGFLVYVSDLIISPSNSAPALWSANAFPVAVLLFNRKANWPILLFFCAGGLLAWGYPTTSYETSLFLIICGMNLFAILLLASLIRRITGTIPTKKKLTHVTLTNIWVAALVIPATAVLSVVILAPYFPGSNFLQMIMSISTHAFLGQFLLLPAILYGIVQGRPALKKMPRKDLAEHSLMWFILFVIIIAALASLKSQISIYYIFPYVTLPLLVWSAIRFRLRITIFASFICCLFTQYLASLGYISFDSTELSSYNQITEMNIGLIALYGTILILAIVMADQKHIKHDLKRKDEWFQIAINNIQGGMYLLDKERRYKIISAELPKKFELPTEVCHLGAHVETALRFRANRGDFGPGDIDELVATRLAKLEIPGSTQGRNISPNGRTYEYFQTHTNTGEIIIMYHEITERLKAEKDSHQALIEARHANKAKTDFLANMSHELRTPLNAIIGFSEIMTNEEFVKSASDKVREYSQDIYMSGSHLLQIINDILDLSKIEAGMADLDLVPIHLDENIRESVTFIELRAAEANISIVNAVTDTDDMIMADVRMFKQIFVNILSNAVKFTPDGGSVHISHEIKDNGATTITVKDTGIGIDNAELDIMMEPFRQADSSLSRKYEGTGLGLPLVKSLIELHGGTVNITSEVGIGTSVLITFPPEQPT